MLDVFLSRDRPPFVLFVLVPFVRSVLSVVLFVFFMSFLFLPPVVLLAPMAFRPGGCPQRRGRSLAGDAGRAPLVCPRVAVGPLAMTTAENDRYRNLNRAKAGHRTRAEVSPTSRAWLPGRDG